MAGAGCAGGKDDALRAERAGDADGGSGADYEGSRRVTDADSGASGTGGDGNRPVDGPSVRRKPDRPLSDADDSA